MDPVCGSRGDSDGENGKEPLASYLTDKLIAEPENIPGLLSSSPSDSAQ